MTRTEPQVSARILIVDDDQTLRQQMLDSVALLGHQGATAENGEEALGTLREQDFDVVITDIKMPGMSGLELLEAVKKEHAPDVIMMTGFIEEYTYDRILEMGASDFIYKPVSVRELRVRLKRVLRERRLFADREAAHSELASAHRQLTRYADELNRSLNELRAAHQELLRVRKLESIGQLAAGIAHEINTPMQYVSNNTEFVVDAFDGLLGLLKEYRRAISEINPDREIRRRIAEAEEQADIDYLLEEIPLALEQTVEGIGRISNIVHSVKQFAHPGRDRKVPVNINEVIENTITVSRGEWKNRADMVTELDDALPPVSCVQGEINQVVLNLVINSVHAIAENDGFREDGARGLIRITSRHLSRSGEVEIRFQDNGCGIPDDLRQRVFDPFFTTKEVGVGTGQGLAIAHTIIVEKHGGFIDFESESGKGTTFTIRLPVDGCEPVD